jgi:hypothetical protein
MPLRSIDNFFEDSKMGWLELMVPDAKIPEVDVSVHILRLLL